MMEGFKRSEIEGIEIDLMLQKPTIFICFGLLEGNPG